MEGLKLHNFQNKIQNGSKTVDPFNAEVLDCEVCGR
jgi:hypothetical protein